MQKLLALRDGLLALLAILGGVATVTLMLHVGADVLMRNVMNQPIPATFEIVTHYYMIAMAFIPLAWVERSGGMVQVEVLDPLLSPRMRALSDRIVAIISTLIYGALFWVTLQTALKNAEIGTFVMAISTRLATWPAYFMLPIGFGLAALVTAIRAVGPQPTSPQEATT